MPITRVLRQPESQSKQVPHVSSNKSDCFLRQVFTCYETSLDVSPDNYTRGSRIVSRTYDSPTFRNLRTKESSLNSFDSNWNLVNHE